MRIACWSGPRNLSTALLRAWENRADTWVSDEPLYAHYLDRTGLEHPARAEVLASQPRSWEVVAASLTGPIPHGRDHWWQKHMAHHLLPSVGRSWLAALAHVFLIREPEAVVASYARVRAHFDAIELGYDTQLELFRWARAELGQVPPVLDRTRLLADPEGQLRALCGRLGVPFDPAMLSWPAGPRPTDGVWADHWYGSVRASTGFAAPRADPVVLPHGCEPLVRACRPTYEELLDAAL